MDVFVLRCPRNTDRTTTDYYPIGSVNVGDPDSCPSCHQDIGMLPWLPPYRVELVRFGDEFTDIAFGGGIDLLVSERFVDHYRRAGLIGLEGFDAVEVVKVKLKKSKRLKQPPKYFRVLPVRGKAAIDDKASEVVREKAWMCSECRDGIGLARLERIVFESGSWSGEDAFFARGLPGIIMVSSKFEEFYRANQLTGAELIPALKYHYDMHAWSFLSNLK